MRSGMLLCVLSVLRGERLLDRCATLETARRQFEDE